MNSDPSPDFRMRRAALLCARLERLSADSVWAHRASGLRNALLRCMDEVERSPAPGAAQAEALDEAMAHAFQVLVAAGREINPPPERH